MNLNYIYLPSLYQSEGVPVTLVTTIMFLSTIVSICFSLPAVKNAVKGIKSQSRSLNVMNPYHGGTG